MTVWPAAGGAITEFIDKRSGVDYVTKGVKKGVAGPGWKEMTAIGDWESVPADFRAKIVHVDQGFECHISVSMPARIKGTTLLIRDRLPAQMPSRDYGFTPCPHDGCILKYPAWMRLPVFPLRHSDGTYTAIASLDTQVRSKTVAVVPVPGTTDGTVTLELHHHEDARQWSTLQQTPAWRVLRCADPQPLAHVQREVGVSQRRACRALQQPRSTQRYPRKVKPDEAALLQAIEALVCQHPRYGYRLIHGLLVGDGFKVGRDRVYGLWRSHGYGVKQKAVKKRRLGVSQNGIIRKKAGSINDVWCWDFIHDRDERGRVLRWLVIEDEFTREGLAVEVRRWFKARDVLDVLGELMLIRGRPGHIRSDNGPEFIAQAIRAFLQQTGVGTLYIEPGAPWQNAYAESFNSRFRDELLSQESFADLAEARQVSGWWQNHYNHRRPHSSLDYQPPARFAATLAASLGRPPLRLGAAPLTCATDCPAVESSASTPTLI